MTKTTRITHDGVSLEVEYEYTLAERGARERGTGVPLEPDYPACVEEIVSVTSCENVVDLMDEYVLERLSEAIEQQEKEREDDHEYN